MKWIEPLNVGVFLLLAVFGLGAAAVLRFVFDLHLSSEILPISGIVTFLVLGDRVLARSIALHRQGDGSWKMYVLCNALLNLLCALVVVAVMALIVDSA